MLTLDRSVRARLCERAISYSGVFGFQWRHVHQLGLLYATSQAGRRSRRRNGETPSWESAKLLLAASLFGVPIGFLGGIYLAEFSGGAVASVVRYAADLLNGVPSIVIGIFAYSMVVFAVQATFRRLRVHLPWD